MRHAALGAAWARKTASFSAGRTPPTPASVTIEQTGDELALTERWRESSFQGGVVAFMLLWWIGWSVGCARGLEQASAKPTLENVLATIPCLTAWALVLFCLCAHWLGTTRVRLGPDGLEQTWNVLGCRGKRCARLDEIDGITEFARVVDGETGRTEHGLRVITRGRSIRFAVGTDAQERQRLAALFEDHLARALERSTRGPRPGAAAALAPPSDSEIAREQGPDGLVFVRRYPLRAEVIAVLTFYNLFWNGIVGLFLIQLVKQFTWGLCVFLLPFEAVGVVMLAAWLGTLARPGLRREWAFGPDGVTERVTFLGVGPARRDGPRSFNRAELRKGEWGRFALRAPEEEDDRAFGLGLVDDSGRDVLVIGGLTRGDARWMADELWASRKGRSSGADAGPLWDHWVDEGG